MANKQTLFCGTVSQYLSKDLIKEADESNGGTAFRIPALINANGTLIAAVDKASTGADWGTLVPLLRNSELYSLIVYQFRSLYGVSSTPS